MINLKTIWTTSLTACSPFLFMKTWLFIIVTLVQGSVLGQCDTSLYSCNIFLLNPQNNIGRCGFNTRDTICMGDTIKYKILNPDCPPYYSSSDIFWCFKGNDGYDTIQSINPTVTYSDTGTFYMSCFSAIVIDNFRAYFTDSFGVTVLPCPPTSNFTAAAQKICATSCITYQDKSTRKPISWHWYFEGGTPSFYSGQNPPPICYTTAGKYKVSLAVESKFGADSSIKIDYIEVVDAPVSNPVDTAFTVQYRNSVELEACFTGSSYRWLPSTGSCDTCPQVTITPSKTIEQYTCIIGTAEGCTDTCNYTIHTEGIFGTIYVPNAFTPNNDGNNDVFQILGNNISLVRLQLFNRWGERVFDTPNINTPWNGYYKDQLQPSGIYIYTVTYFSGIDDVATNLKGSITLVR